MKLIGIDYGRRRIGLAATDSGGIIVRGLTTIDRRKYPRAASAVALIVDREQGETIVLGLPLDADDRDTEMSREVRRFAAQLRKITGIPVDFVDESFSSRHATDILKNRKRKERRGKETADRIAACCILENYLKERS